MVIHGGVKSRVRRDAHRIRRHHHRLQRPARPCRPDNAERDGVEIRLYRIIYDAIEDVQSALKGHAGPKYRDVDLGRAEVRQVYKISNVGTVAGCYVVEVKSPAPPTSGWCGTASSSPTTSSPASNASKTMQRGGRGFECGMTLEKYSDIKEGDVFEAYIVEEYRD